MICSPFPQRFVSNDEIPVTFELLDAKTFLDDANVCCLPFMMRFANSATARDAGSFFADCKRGLDKVGIPIKVDVRNYHVVHEYKTNLTAEGYASLVVGAACGDENVALDYFNSLKSKISLSKQIIARTKKLIREYSEEMRGPIMS